MESLLAADSFRVRVTEGQAEARGLSRHVERFKRTAIQAAPEFGTPARHAQLDAFLESSLHEIADYGPGFPRLDLRVDGELSLRLRSLPELRESIELRSPSLFTNDDQDITKPNRVVEHPDRKGPNIEQYSALSSELGAEAMLLDAEGLLIEGTTTSILWWQDDGLHLVRDPGRVASVTEALIVEAASRLGTIPRRASIFPRDLTRHEAWAVNSVHGIRSIATIDGVPLPAPNSTRLSRYRAALDCTWEPILDL